MQLLASQPSPDQLGMLSVTMISFGLATFLCLSIGRLSAGYGRCIPQKSQSVGCFCVRLRFLLACNVHAPAQDSLIELSNHTIVSASADTLAARVDFALMPSWPGWCVILSCTLQRSFCHPASHLCYHFSRAAISCGLFPRLLHI